ncbi:hypothetical protein TIFTF001_024533 [Ficus carica]|uniref:Uncharacterized protein n=1 Tax=Ficus carica TaxID=3494 RepID=A0AA88DDD2_FICCA|nr:hypothetical protein TIFTF001_024533 [Ficus carica]
MAPITNTVRSWPISTTPPEYTSRATRSEAPIPVRRPIQVAYLVEAQRS